MVWTRLICIILIFARKYRLDIEYRFDKKNFNKSTDSDFERMRIIIIPQAVGLYAGEVTIYFRFI